LCLFVVLPIAAQDAPDNMVHIPGGEFWMGRTHMWLIDELGMHLRPRLDDQPAHLIHIDSFFVDKYEVTNADYAKFTDATGHRKPFHWAGGKIPQAQERLPVYNVSWDDADAYCKFAGKRLPTEAEWERAARGGVEKTLYPWGNQLRNRQEPKRAHYAFPNGPAAVGSYPPNGFGVYDATGNVWEWVGDWYSHSYYSVTPETNPKGPESGEYRVIRGGAWADNDERILSLHYRNFTNPSHRTATVGFRCAQDRS
jgi:iron(II)-dependent oxidoreductase